MDAEVELEKFHNASNTTEVDKEQEDNVLTFMFKRTFVLGD